MEFLPLEILNFIEELAEKYNLDKNLENDPLVKEQLLDTESMGEKQFIKIIYSKEIFPSLILKSVLKDYINKKFAPSALQKEIQEKMSIEEKIAIQLYEDIINNILINNLLKEQLGERAIEDILIKKIIVKDGLSQELK